MDMTQQPTRVKMINAAIDLFHRHGVNATSVDDILKKSGTGKSQFTHYFKNKAGLVQAAIRHLSEIIQTGQTPTGYEINSWKEMEAWFQSYIDYQTSVRYERSCPMGTIGNDLLEDDKELRADLDAFFDWGRKQLSLFFKKKTAAGELPKSTRPQALADLCIATMQGGMLLTKMRRDPEMFENAATEVLTYLKALRNAAKMHA
jgi:AcrR family transcriptional regulator